MARESEILFIHCADINFSVVNHSSRSRHPHRIVFPVIINLQIPTQKVGTFDTELVEEFWLAFTRTAGCTLHIRKLAGSNSHHIIEGAFKSAARTLRRAVSVDPEFAGDIPSTKGVL